MKVLRFAKEDVSAHIRQALKRKSDKKMINDTIEKFVPKTSRLGKNAVPMTDERKLALNGKPVTKIYFKEAA
jgi:hypothetical protein